MCVCVYYLKLCTTWRRTRFRTIVTLRYVISNRSRDVCVEREWGERGATSCSLSPLGFQSLCGVSSVTMRKTPSTARAANNGIGYEWEYAKPQDDRTRWEKIKQGIWNSETHQFLGRTAKSWGESPAVNFLFLVSYINKENAK